MEVRVFVCIDACVYSDVCVWEGVQYLFNDMMIMMTIIIITFPSIFTITIISMSGVCLYMLALCMS